ncbi:efflux RND transporter periplasmic adaptor subunit [Mangrovimonas aestuarii]|uniref:efflux RND transporter periplasmic adaptor subunit n=1 Tax=Mangrovimonas aestuarii TaxID=3018443 RepID=UPI00237992EF|nr:efflux RND transporter periplasmic adaptor subunit [Mangrovimonas aestuarii]
MKTFYSIILASLLLTSCGEGKKKSIEEIIDGGDLAKIREKRTEIVAQQQEVEAKLQQLDKAISELDTIKRLPLVTTFKAKQETFDHFLELQGNVTTKQNLVIHPEMAGILQNVYVKEGDFVNKGQLLAKIDDGGLSQQLSQLEIQKELAKTTFERQARLWEQKIGSEIQYLQAKSSYEAQQKAVKQLRSQLDKTEVRAPFSGVIDDVITEQGSVVSPGQSELIRIVNLSNMYIETDVPERHIKNVIPGKKVKVEFPVLGESIDATIRQAGNYINPANRTFKIEVAVPNKNKAIKPNLTAKLKINDYTNNKALLVPQSIISENANGEQYIYVVDSLNGDNEGVARKMIVKTGLVQGDVIEILNGLHDGIEIIQEGARSVKDGQTVKIINY